MTQLPNTPPPSAARECPCPDEETPLLIRSRRDEREANVRRNKKAIRTLTTAAIFCALFMVAEAIGGYLANSLAIFTDAIHLLSDLISFGISIVALFVAQRPATDRLSFGFYRAEIMGAMFSVFFVWVLTIVLVAEAIRRLINGEAEVKAPIMFFTAIAGILVNIVMGAILGHGGHGHSHGHTVTEVNNNTITDHIAANSTPVKLKTEEEKHDHGHSHGHSHGHDFFSGMDVNMKAALVHVIGDLVQSIGICIASILIWVNPAFWWADPCCTLLFAVLVIMTTVPILKESVMVLMEATPRGIHAPNVTEDLNRIPGVIGVHDLHIWSLTPTRVALAVHLICEDMGTNGSVILKQAQEMLLNNYNIGHVTVQIEDESHAHKNNCHATLEPSCTFEA